MASLSNRAAYTLLALWAGTVACDGAARRGGSAPGGMTTCGPGATGDVCTTAAEDCRCNHACVSGACLELVNPGDAPDREVQPIVNAAVRRVCEKIQPLPCINDFDDLADCQVEVGAELARARRDGCEADFTRVLECINRGQPMCQNPDSDDGAFPPECEAMLEALDARGCPRSCAESRGGGAGAGDCSESVTQDCSNQPPMSASVRCVAPSDQTTDVWTCTCESGLRSGRTFGVSSPDGSCPTRSRSFVDFACGLAP